MFQGKTVIVTGSSVGIGAATAVRFAAEGANVVIHGRNEVALSEVNKKCLEAGGKDSKVLVVVGDISKDEVRQKLVNETVQQFGKIDILVNNAALYSPAKFMESTMDIYDTLFDVNVRSVIALTQLATPHLINSKGNIVNMSSQTGTDAATSACFYILTKATLNHFTKCLALELGPKGVRVNSINPAYIPGTEVLSRVGILGEEQQRYTKMASQIYPLKRTGKIEEVVNAILFIASDKASFSTGMLFPVDGGAAAGNV